MTTTNPMELTNPTSTPLPPWCSELIPDLHDAIWSGGGHHDHAAWCALEVLQRRGLLVQSEPEGVTDGERRAIVGRLRELANAATLGPRAVLREYTMSIPAHPLRDADLVLSTAADWLESASTPRPTIKPVPGAEVSN